MALHGTRSDHETHKPETWQAKKAPNGWRLVQTNGAILQSCIRTKAEALSLKEHGFYVRLWKAEDEPGYVFWKDNG